MNHNFSADVRVTRTAANGSGSYMGPAGCRPLDWRIFGPKNVEVPESWRNERLYDLFSLPDIRVMKFTCKHGRD